MKTVLYITQCLTANNLFQVACVPALTLRENQCQLWFIDFSRQHHTVYMSVWENPLDVTVVTFCQTANKLQLYTLTAVRKQICFYQNDSYFLILSRLPSCSDQVRLRSHFCLKMSKILLAKCDFFTQWMLCFNQVFDSYANVKYNNTAPDLY